jgi:nucleoside-diphosphate-sugar epimerase
MADRVLVTGAAGFIGSHLVEQLLADGHSVVAVDAFIDSYPREYKQRNLRSVVHPRLSFAELDLRYEPLDDILHGVDAVINEAAMPGLPRSWTDFDSYLSNNTHAVQRLLEASARAGVTRFIQVSTSSVYGRDAIGDEEVPTRPVSPYGVTKLAAEHLALAYMQSMGLPVVILRYFSVYGPRQRPDMAYHIFCEALLDRRPLTVYGDGLQSRSSTYVDDCVRGTIGALFGATPGEVYNIGGAAAVSLLDAIHILADSIGVQPVIEFAAARAGDQRETRADTRKAERDFGYRPTVAPVDGLALQAAWHASLRRPAVAAERPTAYAHG